MKKKIVFMGTPQIAVPSLEALINAGFDIPLVMSQPDKPKGRGKQMQFTPVKEVAVAHNIPVYQPEKIKNNLEVLDKLKEINPDFFAVVAYGRILPVEILNIPKYAPINVHFSLLPLYRGAAPVNWAIINGDEYTGISTMKMDVGMDTGDILLVKKTPVLKKNAVDIAEELAVTGANLLVETINRYDNITPKKQPLEGTHAPMMTKEDGVIKWDMDAAYIERLTRGFVPWPTAYTTLDGKILKIFSADVDETINGKPGTIINTTKTSFTVATGNGGLRINELQLEGKRRMTATDFLSGYKLDTGIILGN